MNKDMKQIIENIKTIEDRMVSIKISIDTLRILMENIPSGAPETK